MAHDPILLTQSHGGSRCIALLGRRTPLRTSSARRRRGEARPIVKAIVRILEFTTKLTPPFTTN
jgi:hypothetical protein